MNQPFTTDDVALQNAIAANPADEACWLIYADWLAENDAPRGEYLRTLLELVAPTTTLADCNELRGPLRTLASTVDAAWRTAISTWWAAAPLVAFVTDMVRIGNVPPREMFDRAMSIPTFVLVRGTARRGLWVHLPRAAGEPLRERLSSIETFAKMHDAMSFTDALPQFAVGFFGHHIADAGVPIGARMVEAHQT